VNRYFSVGAILSTITGLFIILLVLLSANIALEAFHREQAANNTLAIVHVERTILSAKADIRSELGIMSATLHARESASPATTAHVFATHAGLNRNLTSVIDALTAYAGASDPGLADIAGKTALYNGKFRQAVVMLENPGSRRDRALMASWRKALTSLLDALNAQAIVLARDIPKTDAFLNEMSQLNELSWNVRVAAGNERRVLATAVAEGRLSSENQLKLSEMAGGIDSLWAAIEGDVRFSAAPPALKAAVQHANDVYFTQFRALRKQAITQLAESRGAMMPEQEWMIRSTPGLNSIADVSKTALDLTEAYCEKLAKIGRLNFAAAIALMLLSIALASFMVFYIFHRVIRPLKLITGTVGNFAAGTLDSKVPFTNRQDEIGDFARTLQKFRVGEVERQRLKAELIANQAEKRAAETSNRMKTEFLANMSHELRTPLNAIIGFSEVIRSEILGPGLPRYREYANDIHGAGNHLLSLINDILDISKADAGKLSLHPEPVELEHLVKECVRLVRGRASEKGLRIVLRMTPMAPLMVDRLRVKQILLNLLSNAIKFTEQGIITVDSCRDAAGRATICVRDTGIGIETEKIPLMFEPFRQVDSTLSRKYEGTGLGLYLVKKLIELHDGEVRIVSALGRGTSVRIVFPASRNIAVSTVQSA
jgi:signal transduction histidine kinase